MRSLTIDLTKQVVLTEKNLIQYKEKNTNNSVPFVITYHPALSNLSNIVREHWTTFGKLKVTIIDHNAKWDDKSRQERESFWIRKRKMESMKTSNILS
jgi:DNA-directed RNA polymerase alpha subunit